MTPSHLKSLKKGVFAMAKITLFSKNNCMQCKMTKKFLEKEGADFEEINIEAGDIIFSGFQPAKLKEIL